MPAPSLNLPGHWLCCTKSLPVTCSHCVMICKGLQQQTLCKKHTARQHSGLLLDTKAPYMMPHSVDFSFLFISAAAALLQESCAMV